MKGVFFEEYGSPEQVLSIREIEKPTPKEQEILIRVYCTTINDYDWAMVRGMPWIYRLMSGISKPRQKILGMELSGVVESIGKGVQKFNIGDPVYGDISQYGFGTFAEYVAINENAVLKKPEFMSFEEAAALPHASLLALQALKDTGQINEGQNILVNGGGGGVGSVAVQIAKLFKCKVTGVDTGSKLDMMKTIGFDEVIDFRKEDFTRRGVQYQLILDCKSTRLPLSYLKALAPGGRYVSIGGHVPALLGILVWRIPVSLFSSKKLHILMLKPNRGLPYIAKLCEEQKVRSVIDGPYSMADIPGLVKYFGEGEHRGKIVVRMK